jgi:hypothetical protein
MFKRQLRTETNCLNCNNQVAERYCGYCGQENLEAKIPVGDLIKESFQQLVDVDGKFYKTFIKLFTQPGLVAKEYTSGKRKSFTHPIRLFFVFGALFLITLNLQIDPIGTAREVTLEDATKLGFEINSAEYNQAFEKHKKAYTTLFGSMVYVIILSVPLFAFLSKIFLRSKTKPYYVDHLIYALYNYIVYFIPLGLIMIFYYFLNSDNPKDNKWGLFVFVGYVLVHGTIASKRFLEYKTFGSIVAGILQLIFLLFSVIAAFVFVIGVLYIFNSDPVNISSQ